VLQLFSSSSSIVVWVLGEGCARCSVHGWPAEVAQAARLFTCAIAELRLVSVRRQNAEKLQEGLLA
jgi:hypothetical protein